MSTVTWTENGTTHTARWHSENGTPPPGRIVVVDDRLTAAAALRFARAGTGMLWRGDFPHARQLVRAMDRRLPRPSGSFAKVRSARAERATLLGKVLVVVDGDHSLQLRRAPDIQAACEHAFGGLPGTLLSLRELLGALSAYQWHQKGIAIKALGARLYPAYSVFAPTRSEYLDLVAQEPLPGNGSPVVFDIGTGTGVLAAILARRGAAEVLATDLNPRAVRCARDNLRRLGLSDRVRVLETDLWPAEQRADLVVCNPPWLPGNPASALELGIYDASSAMLNRFLDGLPGHLTPHGEGWLILSDLAEHLGLRTRADLLARIAAAGLEVAGRRETTPRHRRATDSADPLHAQRSRERTALWRLTMSRA
ncbi:class I SAM-dependent methyltransferase [Amycolatopsis rubida]|uniref:Class I SAM-dependent methyltransferase n=1 Tax=Amycolatopsis rubida TaxID=112413 RepID=A0ABX0C109_9PSEU|nr:MULTISPECIES: class I SAM-dependent methyltransferase [Amycolatopsis]MYW96515.1 methyltransferase [Amycolatopsis rubida]NEC61500.1 class I SAM-dependent methyltransferase [Amycolatopsis rubida]OAP25866.1 Release factor glutamine methyltransferase [Amycolatopsis sp. M39]